MNIEDEKYSLIDSDENFKLYVRKIKIAGKLVCQSGHFIDEDTNQNLGTTVRKEIICYDENNNLLRPFKTKRVRWVKE